MAVFGLGVVVAPIVGPTLGGWITDNYSWRWIFYINLPVCLLAILLTKLLIEDPPYIQAETPKSIDYIGFILMAVGLGALPVVLDRGERADWFSAGWVWLAVIASGACLLGFVIWELNSREPIVDLHILIEPQLHRWDPSGHGLRDHSVRSASDAASFSAKPDGVHRPGKRTGDYSTRNRCARFNDPCRPARKEDRRPHHDHCRLHRPCFGQLSSR